MFNCGEKFSFRKVEVDVEIIGVYPASQTKDGITEYVALFNGEKMRVKESFFEMLKKAEVKFMEGYKAQDIKAEEVEQETKVEKVKETKPKKERKNGRRK